MSRKEKISVFLSHSSADKNFVRKLASRLKDYDIRCWLDEAELNIGDSLTERIGRAIVETDYFIIVLSKASIKSRWVKKELQIALEKEFSGKHTVVVLPLLLDIDPSQRPPFLRDKIYADFRDFRNFEKALRLLLRVFGMKESDIFSLPETVFIPGGEFMVGFEKKKVFLPDFEIGRFPVTNKEYSAFIRATKSKPPDGWLGALYPEGEDYCPVVNVDGSDYCKWLSKLTDKKYHLPSELEWEKAARGTDGRNFPWGNRFLRRNIPNAKSAVPVGTCSPEGDSPYGCSDMVGNVGQWVIPLDKELESKGLRAVRGGCVTSDSKKYQCAFQDWVYMYYAPNSLIGFRVAISDMGD